MKKYYLIFLTLIFANQLAISQTAPPFEHIKFSNPVPNAHFITGQYEPMIYGSRSGGSIPGGSSSLILQGGAASDRHIFFRTADQTRMFIQGNGNVGINTTAPASLAHFVFNRNSTSFGTTSSYFILSNENTTPQNFSGVVFSSNAAGLGTSLISARHNRDAANSGRLTFYVRDMSGNLVQGMTLDENNRVGIGVINPTEKLDVLGNGKFSGNLNVNGQFSINRTNTIHANRGKVTFSHTLTDFNHTIYNNLDNIDGEGSWDGMKFNVFQGAWFRTGDVNNFVNALYINENGRIGINTTTISSEDALAVNGHIKAKQVKVTVDGWSDFVFEKDYHLMPLKEVENFIKANKHLPEIPSAKEVEENGISLGEMDAKLLQKIEELTLYMIEQGKQIESLKKENEEMKKTVRRLNRRA